MNFTWQLTVTERCARNCVKISYLLSFSSSVTLSGLLFSHPLSLPHLPLAFWTQDYTYHYTRAKQAFYHFRFTLCFETALLSCPGGPPTCNSVSAYQVAGTAVLSYRVWLSDLMLQEMSLIYIILKSPGAKPHASCSFPDGVFTMCPVKWKTSWLLPSFGNYG